MFEMMNKTKGKLPSLPFNDIKKAVLGEKYDLSLVFVGNTLSRKLNREHRSKDAPTNILSFPLSDSSGEIFINLPHSFKEAPLFERTKENFIGFLFIHGLLHLKGYDHGSTMEREERKIRKRYDI